MLNSYDEVQHGSPASHQSGNHFTARHNELTVTKFDFFFLADALSPFSQNLDSDLAKHKKSMIAEIDQR